MGKWRPKDWGNKYRTEKRPSNSYASIFEAGADAMLEALMQGPNIRTYGVQVAADPSIVERALPNEAGFWAFIPDNK